MFIILVALSKIGANVNKTIWKLLAGVCSTAIVSPLLTMY